MLDINTQDSDALIEVLRETLKDEVVIELTDDEFESLDFDTTLEEVGMGELEVTELLDALNIRLEMTLKDKQAAEWKTFENIVDTIIENT